MKTEGHVQYNGGWKFYLTYQPSLSCEFSDHRTCKTRSEDYDAKLSDEEKAANDAAKLEQAANVDAAAAEQARAAQLARVNEAGRRKHEATRENGLRKVNALASVEKKCADKLASLTAIFETASLAARTKLDDETDEIIKGHMADQAAINTTDFLALVVADEASEKAGELEAKADAEQAEKDAKAKADAEAAQLAALEANKAEAEAAGAIPSDETLKAADGENAAQP